MRDYFPILAIIVVIVIVYGVYVQPYNADEKYIGTESYGDPNETKIRLSTDKTIYH